jgi:hypothetical protein
MTLPGTVVIKSTSDLTPDKILGYAKGIVVAIGGVLTIINEQVVPDDWTYKGYLTAAIAICTLIGAVLVPNAVKPVEVPPPAINVEPTADQAPVIPADVLEEPPMVDPLLGVAGPPVVVDVPLPDDPPGKHEANG